MNTTMNTVAHYPMGFTKALRTEDRPRERFMQSPQLASMTDLIAIVLGTGTKKRPALALAEEVREKYMDGDNGNQNYNPLMEDLTYQELMEIPGIGKTKAVQLCAAIELGRRLTAKHGKRNMPLINAPERIYEFFGEKLRHETQEHFIVAYANTKMRLLAYKEIGRGNLNAAPADIKEALKWAIRYKAPSIFLIHNHPSGYPNPSPEDINVTRSFAAAAKLIDTNVIDHIIIGDGTFVSLHERGVL